MMLSARGRKTDKHGACQVTSNTVGVFSFSSPDTGSGTFAGKGPRRPTGTGHVRSRQTLLGVSGSSQDTGSCEVVGTGPQKT